MCVYTFPWSAQIHFVIHSILLKWRHKTHRHTLHLAERVWVCVRVWMLLFFWLTCHRLHRKIQGKKWHWQSSNSESRICWMCMGRLINSNYRFSSELNVCATSQSNDTQSCVPPVCFNRLFIRAFVQSYARSFIPFSFHCHAVCCRRLFLFSLLHRLVNTAVSSCACVWERKFYVWKIKRAFIIRKTWAQNVGVHIGACPQHHLQTSFLCAFVCFRFCCAAKF